MNTSKPKSTLFGIAASILSTIENDTRLKDALIIEGNRKHCKFTILIDCNEMKCSAMIDHNAIVDSINQRIRESQRELKKIFDELGLKQKQDYEF